MCRYDVGVEVYQVDYNSYCCTAVCVLAVVRVYAPSLAILLMIGCACALLLVRVVYSGLAWCHCSYQYGTAVAALLWLHTHISS